MLQCCANLIFWAMTIRHCWGYETLIKQKLMCLDQMLYSLVKILKATINFKIHQNLFKYCFTLLHFANDDPVFFLLWTHESCKFLQTCVRNGSSIFICLFFITSSVTNKLASWILFSPLSNTLCNHLLYKVQFVVPSWGRFIYILDSLNSSSFTFWSSKLASSSRSNWTGISNATSYQSNWA